MLRVWQCPHGRFPRMAGCPDQAWCSLRHLAAEALWALMHINEIEYCQTRQSLLPATTKLGQGNIFTSVCQEFCPQGGRVSASVHAWIHPLPPEQTPPLGADTPPGSIHPPWEQTPPLGADTPGADTPPGNTHPPGTDTPPEQTPLNQTPPQEADCSIRSTSGRYASYWNAFLFTVRKENYTNSLNEFMLLIPLPPYSQDESKISQT